MHYLLKEKPKFSRVFISVLEEKMKPLADLESKSFDVSQVFIVDLIERTGVQLDKKGRTEYTGLCPLHNDKDTPSLTVYTLTNSWACFGGCQGRNGHNNGGDGIDFIRQRYSYSFREAVKWIEDNFSLRSLNIKTVLPEIKKPEPKIVPPNFVQYYHSKLEQEHRKYFYSRGFKDWFIDQELWGWTGHRYALPVWEGEPGNSDCLGIRMRKPEGVSDNSPKYVGLKDMNPPTIWGRWYCREARIVLAFAGEFDSALSNQDELPSFSLVNGMKALEAFPSNWPELWFPNSKNMIACFDKKEEVQGAKLCYQWNKVKTVMSARVFHWPPDLDVEDCSKLDYSEFRKEHSAEEFKALILRQGLKLD